MIASVMMYGAVVATIVGLAALAIEHSCTVLKRPRRVIWMLALAVSIALPIVSIAVKHARPTPQASTGTGNDIPAVEPADNPSPVITSSSFGAISAAPQPLWPERPNLDTILKALWLVSSLGVVAFYGLGWVRLRYAARTWSLERIDGHTVFVADQLGPAVVGFLKPAIVLPRWLLTAPASTRATVLAHEQAHIAARDPLFILGALLLTALAPWNLALLWQLRRLRFAVEVDCDARVLSEGMAPSVYGEILLTVGVHNSKTPGVAVALTEPASQLERRIRILASEASEHAKLIATAYGSLSVVLLLGCAQVNVPAIAPRTAQTGASVLPTPEEIARRRAEQEAPRQVIAFDPAHFDKYVGYYELSPNFVFTVTRDGTKFYDQLTGQRIVELYPESETKFFETVVAAQLSFVSDKSGHVTGLILHQNGREQRAPRITEEEAKTLESARADHIKNNTPSPGVEASIRKWFAAVENGEPNYEDMTPELAAAAREQWPQTSQTVKTIGALKALTFARVDPIGNDIFKVEFEHAQGQVTIAPLTFDGKVAARSWNVQPILSETEMAARAQRIKDNKPSPGTEAYLRNYLVSAAKGDPDYSGMGAALERAAREQWSARKSVILARGALKSLTFLRVNPQGNDVYDAVYEHSELEWTVAPLDPDGKEGFSAGTPLPGSK